ncbi:hypothetical protein [Streptomyces albospinus]|nr:hypothetical protein [Streptomyces albospinus]
MPLSGRRPDLVRRDGLTVSAGQTVGKVALDGLMEVAEVRVTRR